MNDKLFSELLESMVEGVEILNGKTAPSRVFTLSIASKHPEVLLDTQRSSAKGKGASKVKDKKPTPPSK